MALIFYCSRAWLGYPRGDQERWPTCGEGINYNAIRQLDLFCKKEGNRVSVLCPVFCLFLCFLGNHPEWMSQRPVGSPLLAALGPMPSPCLSGEGSNLKAPAGDLHPHVLESNRTAQLPTGYLSIPITEDRLSQEKSGSFTNDPDSMSKPLRVTSLFRLTWDVSVRH